MTGFQPNYGAVLSLTLLLTVAACTEGSTGGEASTGTVPASSSIPSTSSVLTTSTTSSTTTTSVPIPTAGSSGLGDPYYPELGNGGYDVERYAIELSFDPETSKLDARVRIDATATQDLSAFNLDFVGFEIVELTVDGADASFVREDGELTVTPADWLAGGEAFTVEIGYRGVPEPVESLTGPYRVGWFSTLDGAFVASTADGAQSWFPGNHHPLDKGEFSYRITVPDSLVAAANGMLVNEVTTDGTTTWEWEHPGPMATHLATVVIGDYEIVSDEVSAEAAGVAIRNVLAPDLAADPPDQLELQGEMIAFFADLFGPYPFESYGVASVSEFPGALEMQTLSLFAPDGLREKTLAHEIAHQWFGNAVSPARWQDVWLSEGFARYSEWLWLDESGVEDLSEITLEAHFNAELLDSAGNPPPSDLYALGVYEIGALTLHHLRLEIGDDAFFETLRTYFTRFSGAAATTEDFIGLAEEVSGADLSELFDAWLYAEEIPPPP